MTIQKNNILLKEDAVTISDLKKEEYINEKIFEFFPTCMTKVRESALKAEYSTIIHIPKIKFVPQIVERLAVLIKSAGYQIGYFEYSSGHAIKIFWGELDEKDKKILL
jgi:hypothetical protein